MEPARSTTRRTGVHLLPMIIGIRHHAAEPVEEIQNLRTANAGEQIFVAATEPDDFMREHRSDDDELVVIENPPVDLHRHIHREKPAGKFANLTGRYRADVLQRSRIVPLVIEEVDPGVGSAPLLKRDLEPLANGFLAHRLVRAQRDQDVDGLRRPLELLVEGLEHQAHRCRARAVRDNEQNACPGVVGRGAGPGDNFRDIVGRNCGVRRNR